MIGKFLERQRAGEVLREEMQRLDVLEVTQHVHLLFHVAVGVLEIPAQRSRQSRPVGSQGRCARIEQLIEQDRMLRQVLRGPRARAHQLGDAGERLRVLLEEREVGFAPADGLE